MTELFLIWSISASYIAWKWGFFKVPQSNIGRSPFVTVKDLGLCFFIYLAIALGIAPILARGMLLLLNRLDPTLISLPITCFAALQLVSALAIFFLLQTPIDRRGQTLYHRIWKDRRGERQSTIPCDLLGGALTWLVCFPIVALLGDLIAKLLKALLGYSAPEQTAVLFVKIAARAPLALAFALLSVIVMAPLVEEFLFRGVLQSFLKRRVGTKTAIALSALLFALFHFSTSQALGNITLIISLFVLGLFLGLLYERHRSLWAPIALHTTFNIISAMRILLMGGA